jgi:hypothetical protein
MEGNATALLNGQPGTGLKDPPVQPWTRNKKKVRFFSSFFFILP